MTTDRIVGLILVWSGFFTFGNLYVKNFESLSSDAAGWLGFLLFLYGAVTLAYTTTGSTGGNE